MTVLCLAERDGDGIAAASLAAISLARSLAEGRGSEVAAVVFGPDAPAPELTDAGVAEVCAVSAAGLTGYAPVAWARALQSLAAERQAVAVVAAATDRGAEVLAHLGALTGLPVAANCVQVRPLPPPDGQAGQWQLVRQRWAGSVLEDAVLDAPLALITVASDAAQVPADAPAGPREPRRTAFTPELTAADLLVQASETQELSTGISLATARVVVGGGRGVGGPEGFAALEELASLLGGVVGVSRVVTSAGWRPHRQQVGQTGTKISPELYLACGISGAIQHMAGCLSARHIIAVNTDPDAPIIGRAEYAVIADLHELIPALVAAIRGRQGAAGAEP
jgi:electron transfer flavoprotein alpha subunit